MSKTPKKIKSLGLFSRLFRFLASKEIPKPLKKKQPPTKLSTKPPIEKSNLPMPKNSEHWEVRRKEDALYSARPLALIGFPMTKPKPRSDAMHLVHERRNGNFMVEIHGHAKFGVPFGQDELLLIAIIDHALKGESPKIEIGSIYRILKDLGMDVGGRKYKLIQQALLRIFGSNLTYWFQNEHGGAAKKSSYFSIIHLEFLKDKYDYNSKKGDFVVLSDDFWRELKEHPIPYDLEVLRRLKNFLGAMKLYLWAAPRAYRIAVVPGIIYVPITELANELGSEAIKNPRAFKQNLKNWIAKLDDILLETSRAKSEIRIQDDKVILPKSNLVPGSHRKKSNLQLADQSKTSTKTKEKSNPKKEFDLDWVLEKEIHEFIVSGLRTSLSKQALAYRAHKKEVYKDQYKDEDDLFPGALVN